MPSAPTFRPLAAVIHELVAAVPMLAPRRVPVAEAVGAVLAEPLVAPSPVPHTGLALRSGYAVNSRDLVGASGYSPVPLLDPPPKVEAGDALPPGTDAVLPPDALAAAGAFCEALACVAPGENAVRPGEDAARGQVLREAGAIARAVDAAIARAIAVEAVAVRKARIAVLAAESELELPLGRVPGAEIQVFPARSAAESDIFGGFDLAFVIAHRPGDLGPGFVLASPGLALRPGDATQVGLAGACILIHCPPRLDAAFAVGRCLVRPLVRHLTGQRPPVPWQRGALTRKVASTVGLAEIALLRATHGGFEPLAVGALPLGALGRADAWTLISPESEGFAAGETVAVESLSF